MFDNIIGYDYVKEELKTIINWYSNDEFVKNENAKLPNGIIFRGAPGNGKTLFIKELKKHFKDNAFVVNGNSTNILKEITDIYDEARTKELALVLIDEIDLLIDNNGQITRILQDELDGLNKGSSRVLTIATTNNILDLPEPLLRSGRFDRIIKIDKPEPEDRKNIFMNYLDKLNIKTSFNDIDNVMDYLSGLSCAEIMTLCNDCYFRYYGETINEEKIRQSFSKIDKFGSSINNETKTLEVAYHEIGHALLVLKYEKEFYIREVKYINDGGICKYSRKEEQFKGYKSAMHDAEIGLGGMIAERLFFNDISLGSENDLSEVRRRIDHLTSSLPNKVGLILNEFNRYKNEKTEKTRYKNEKESNKLLEKCYRRAYKYLKKHKQDIIKYGKLLFDKGYLMKEDFS